MTVRSSWRKPNALKGASQRTLSTLKPPAGNTAWYKKWYERWFGHDTFHLRESVTAMTADDVVMPSAVRQQLDHLLTTIKRAATSDEAERAGIRAEGFVLGVERLKALPPASIEALYLVVEQAVESRAGELASQA